LNLKEISYNNIGDILKQCLTFLEKEDDYESYKLIIILACCLYKTSEESNKPRIFLQNYILDFPIWQKFDFWKDIIQYEINEEMIKQKKCNLFNKENEQNKLKRMHLIVKSQLNTYLFNMISFGVDNSIMNQIISYFKCHYFLDNTIVDSLNNIIKNYSKKNNDKENSNIEKGKDETITDIGTKNETTISNDNDDNDEAEISRNCTFNIEGNILNSLLQKEPCDNTLKAKKRQKKEKEEKNMQINQKLDINDNLNIGNLNINLINKDNNDENNLFKEEIELDKNINYVEINNTIKNKKRNSDEYKEEDIVSKMAVTDGSSDKNDIYDTYSIRENSNLNIISEDINK
jgi:hypothetical protein